MGYRGKVREQEEARVLRAAGLTMPAIAERLGISRSSVSLWTRDVPFTPGPDWGRPPDRRPRQPNGWLRRFFDVVSVAIVLMLATGGWMLSSVTRASTSRGLAFNMPLDWLAMISLGLVMIAFFGHIRFNLFRRLQRAVQAQDGAAGAAALGQLRAWVVANLVLGVIVVVVMRLGAAG